MRSAEQLYNAPLADLIRILLKQFKRLLNQRGVDYTTDEAKGLARAIAEGDAPPEKVVSIRAAMNDIVAESETLLQERWNLSFGQSLDTGMNDIPGWESTAEFLEIANEKSNAELRIAAGAALLVMLGDRSHVETLHTVIEHDAGANDADAVFARRALESVDGA